MNYYMVTNDIIQKFKNLLGDKFVLTEKNDLIPYSKDETSDAQAFPDAVLKPENAQQISQIIRIANEYLIPVTPRGLGTGVSGGALPIKGGIVLSLERFTRIIDIDKGNMVTVVEPGVITGKLSEAVEKQGLFYPPDPASLDSCSIGGNIAESAGGPRAVKYGTTKDYVRGLEIVLPTGEMITLGGRIHKDVTGYNIIGIIIGSEGTLAIVTKIILKLLPLPKFRVDLLIPFQDFRNASSAINKIFETSIIPVNIEFIEKKAINALKLYLEEDFPFSEAGAHLLVGIDGNTKENIEKEYETIGEVCLNSGAIDVFVADTPQTKERLWKARRSLHDALEKKSRIMEREDVVVPVTNIPDLLDFIHRLSEETGLEIVPFGHAGDGNVHVNILKMDTPETEWKRKSNEAVEKLLKEVIRLGGTLSGEHGIGIVKKKFIPLSMSKAEIDLAKRIKQAFDPNNILNPGKIFQ
ncbi:FAD-binding protein [candidate division WOR-3 bacterium]|nr:FAD-binding protein [candidate division WOR-3 bacterium]